MSTRLTFGLVAAQEDDAVIARFDALAAWVREHTPLELERRTAPTYKKLAESVREGTSDVAWLPPVPYAWLAEGVNPLGSIVRGGKITYCAALVVLETSKIEALSDLKMVKAGWVDPWSAAGYVVPRLDLTRAKIDVVEAFAEEKFYGSHRDALTALRKGECDVVGTYARSAGEGAWSEVEDLRVRVLHTSDPIPSDVIAVRRNLGPREHEVALDAFKKASADDEGRRLMRAVFDGDELREGTEPAHDSFRMRYESGVARGVFD